MSPLRILGLLVLLLLLGGVGLFLYTHHREEVEHWSPPSGRARSDDYYAAALLLEGLGIPTRQDSLRSLPGTDTVVLVLGPSSSERRKWVNPLKRWVEEGGHLIVSMDAHADPLAAAFMVLMSPVKDLREAEELDGELSGEGSRKVKLLAQWKLRGPPKSKEVEVKAGEEKWVTAVTVSLKKGQVTVLSDGAAFSNDRIGNAEHARWLRDLVESEHFHPREALLVQSAPAPNPWEAIWRHAWFVVVSGTTLLGCWLWAKSRRFGPLLPALPVDRRGLVEHLEATGRFRWRQRNLVGLLAPVRASLLREASAPGPAASLKEQATWKGELSRRSGVDLPSLERALSVDPGRDRALFTEMMQTLQTLRRST